MTAMNTTQRTGLRSELAFQARCVELGIECAVPIGVERYDLLARFDDRWSRIQVKTARRVGGYVEFNTKSNAEGVGRPVSYDGFADAIGAYAPDLDRCFLVPVDQCPRSVCRLRIDATTNGQMQRIRWAADFAL